MLKRTTLPARKGLSCLFAFTILVLIASTGGAADSAARSAAEADPWSTFEPSPAAGNRPAAVEDEGVWPTLFEDAERSQIQSHGCRTAMELPQAQALTRIRFAAYETRAPDTGAQAEILRLASLLANNQDGPLYVVGTSYSDTEKPHRLMSLAISRARSVAQSLARHGVAADRLTCVPMSGAVPPRSDWDKSAIIYSLPR
jgi:outer membrane protein OmpA-like peptidoglycan-associated protein